MSDEPQPLRLKPRLKVDPAASATPGAEPTVAPAAGAGPDRPPAEATIPPADHEKPRLKPRLGASADPAPAPANPVSGSQSPISTPILFQDAPVLFTPAAAGGSAAPVTPPAAPAAPEPGKFKLKPKPATTPPMALPVVAAVSVPETAPHAAGSTPPVPAAAESTPGTGEPPVDLDSVADADASAAPKLKMRPPAVPGVGAPKGSPIPLPAGNKKRAPKSRLLMIAAAALVLLGGGGFAVWQFFLKPEPPPALVVRPKVAPKTAGTPGTTPGATAGTATPAPAVSTAGKEVEKAKAAIAGRTADGKAAAPGIIEDRVPAAPSPAAAPAQSGPAPATADVKVSPGITATTKSVESTTGASPAFRSWVINAKITGVRSGGNNPAATINGRLITRGGNVDDALGIVLESIDADKKELVFRDKTGATVARPYF